MTACRLSQKLGIKREGLRPRQPEALRPRHDARGAKPDQQRMRRLGRSPANAPANARANDSGRESLRMHELPGQEVRVGYINAVVK